MPAEAVFVMLVLFVAFPAVLFNGIAKLRRTKGAEKGGGGDALRMSELKTLIDEQVAYATAPLRERIEALEEIESGRSDDVRLIAPVAAPRLALPDDDEADAAPAHRARVRA